MQNVVGKCFIELKEDKQNKNDSKTESVTIWAQRGHRDKTLGNIPQKQGKGVGIRERFTLSMHLIMIYHFTIADV